MPSNEPYLGREPVYVFDVMISDCMTHNTKVAAFTHKNNLNKMQEAACQLIPQGIHIALTIREMVRQGYLLGAYILIRPLLERCAILSYLDANPSEVDKWHAGWEYNGRPSLKVMLTCMSDKIDEGMAKKVIDHFNHIVHGDPYSSKLNLVELHNGKLGYTVGKNIDAPDLCDEVCHQALCYLIVLRGMMVKYFPDVK